MDKLDPQVQIRVIDLAESWAGGAPKTTINEGAINSHAKHFAQAYKAIIKTLTEK